MINDFACTTGANLCSQFDNLIASKQVVEKIMAQVGFKFFFTLFERINQLN